MHEREEPGEQRGSARTFPARGRWRRRWGRTDHGRRASRRRPWRGRDPAAADKRTFCAMRAQRAPRPPNAQRRAQDNQDKFHFDICLLFLLAVHTVGNADGQCAARNDHKARGTRQRRDEHEQQAHHDQRSDGDLHVLAEVLIRHRAEERRDDVGKRRLEHGALQHGLQRHEQRHAEREHDDGHERGCCDRERRDDLVSAVPILVPTISRGVDGTRIFILMRLPVMKAR